jgi:hypothetical protein
MTLECFRLHGSKKPSDILYEGFQSLRAFGEEAEAADLHDLYSAVLSLEQRYENDGRDARIDELEDDVLDYEEMVDLAKLEEQEQNDIIAELESQLRMLQGQLADKIKRECVE